MISKTVASGSLCSLLQLARLFCTANKPIIINSAAVSLSNNGKLMLSDDLQRALWAQAFINLILSAQPSFEQIKKQSLHSRLLNLEWPYSEQTKGYEISKQIELEMKRFFMPKVGIYFPREIYDQQRFDKGKSKQYYMTFYPTYTTTQEIFTLISKYQTILFYGKWGIGKSQSIILYCMLSIYVRYYNIKYMKMRSQERKKFYTLLKAIETTYWSINQKETMEKLLKKVYYQKPWQWDIEQKLNLANKEQTQYQFQQNYLMKKQKLKLNQIMDSGSTAIFDQINAMASVKRRYIQSEKQIEKLQKLSQTQNEKQQKISQELILDQKMNLNQIKEQSINLNFLLKQMQKNSTIWFYNSSSNIETNLMASKKSNSKTMYLYSQHGLTKPTAFNYQYKVSLQKGNVGMLQLAQFFTNIMQEFSNFSKEVVQQWECQSKQNTNARQQFFMQIQDEFINTEWGSIPNAALIVMIFRKQEVTVNKNQIQQTRNKNTSNKREFQNIEQYIRIINAQSIISECRNVAQLKVATSKIIEELKNSTRINLQAHLDKFIFKSEDNQTNKSRSAKIHIYTTALLAALKYQNLPKEQQPLSFQFLVSSTTQAPNIIDSIDKQVFNKTGSSPDQKTVLLVCSMSPKAFSQAVLAKALKKQTGIINQFMSQELFAWLVLLQNDQLGREFERRVIDLFDTNQRISINFEITNQSNEKFTILMDKYKILKIKNFVKDQKSSFAQKFQQVFQALQREIFGTWVICKPQQFFYKKSGNNYAFDMACIYGYEHTKTFQFIDFTLSMSQKTLKGKMVKFIQMLSQQAEFEQLTKPAQSLEQKDRKILDMYKKRINFIIISLQGENQYLTKEEVEQLFSGRQSLKNLALNLEVKFAKCYLSQNVLMPRNQKQINKAQKDILQLNSVYKAGLKNYQDAQIKRLKSQNARLSEQIKEQKKETNSNAQRTQKKNTKKKSDNE